MKNSRSLVCLALALCLLGGSSAYAGPGGQCPAFGPGAQARNWREFPLSLFDSAYWLLSAGNRLIEPQLPILTLAQAPRVRVGSFNVLSDATEIPQRIAGAIADFDERYEALGFRIPQETKVIVYQNRVFPGAGPASFESPLVSLEPACFRRVMRFAPIGRDREALTDRWVIAHHRAHTILTTTYHRRSNVVADRRLREALADFFASHFLNLPRPEEVDPAAYNDVDVRVRNGRVLASAADLRLPMDARVFIANLLWRIRASVGADAIDGILPSIVDGLSRYQVDSAFHPAETSAVARRQEVEWVMAVILRVSRDTAYRGPIEAAIESFASETEMSASRANRLAATLIDTGSAHRSSGRSLTSVAMGLAATGVGVAFDVILILLATGGI